MAAGVLPVVERRVFRIFISYASEDLAIATAVAGCFKTALPDFFAEINLDKDFLEPGSAFQTQIEAKLQATDVLVIVYTGMEKSSHSFTGWEVGYFDRIMRTEPEARKKISLFLFAPPATTASDQGIPIGLSKDQLKLSVQQFELRFPYRPKSRSAKRSRVGSKQSRATWKICSFQGRTTNPNSNRNNAFAICGSRYFSI